VISFVIYPQISIFFSFFLKRKGWYKNKCSWRDNESETSSTFLSIRNVSPRHLTRGFCTLKFHRHSVTRLACKKDFVRHGRWCLDLSCREIAGYYGEHCDVEESQDDNDWHIKIAAMFIMIRIFQLTHCSGSFHHSCAPRFALSLNNMVDTFLT